MGLGKYFNGGNLMQVALALSMMRPDSQQYIGQPGPTATQFRPYNMTNSVFNPVTMSPSTTVPTTERIWAAKEAAIADAQNPLSRFLDVHVNPNQFENDAVAMLFEGEPCGSPSRRSIPSESESGYNSDGALSPSASARSEPCSDVAEFGATGFTLPSSTVTEEPLADLNGILNLDDFLDLNGLESAVKAEPLSPVFDEGVGNLKNQPLSRCTSGADLYSPGADLYFDESKCLDGVDLQPSSLGFDFDALYGPPLGVDTTNIGQQFADGANIDDLDLEFNFPPDILSPVTTENNQNQDLLSHITGSPEQHSRTGSPAHSDLSLEEALLYHPAATGTRVLKTEPTEIRELPATLPDVPQKYSKGVKGARPKVSAPRVPRLPVPEGKLIELPVNDFNELIAKLDEEEAQYARDIRRRGKNKEAARLCRKRKIENIDTLDGELQNLKDEKARILEERRKLEDETRFWKTKVGELEGYIFKSLIDEHGQPLSPSEYSLFQGSNGNVYVGKDINSQRPKKT